MSRRQFHSAGAGTCSRVVYAIGDAGAGTAAWHAVRAALDDDIELRAVRLPGRESRFVEPPVSSIDAQVDDIAAGLVPLQREDHRPYAVAGVCSGAVTAYELVRHLEGVDVPGPAALLVISQQPPARIASAPERPKAGMSREELRAWLLEIGGVPAGAGRADMFDLIEPMLRADIQALESYRHRAGPRLECPVFAIRGASDHGVSDEDLAAWAETTGAAFTARTVPGGRHLLRDAAGQVAAGIAAMLPSAAASRTGGE